jgi:EAL domain-containing protein (putative c-di-GMP-specific phosphodiesterase class I)
VEIVAQRILDALAQPFKLGREVSYLSGSVGITLYPNDAASAEEMQRKADQAMYAAKNSGKNRFAYFTEEMDRRAHLRLRLANELRSALAEHQLEVHYQPVIDLRSGRIVKAEALLRWQHPRLGTIRPSEFIPVAEESGSINIIGDWVLSEAAQRALEWGQVLGRTFQIGVNRSPAQFLSRGGEDPVQYLSRMGLSGKSISMEITEGLLMHASDSIAARLLELRDAGLQVAIDDFGTGYSSMAYLKRFDIDYLKIDQSFVQDMEHDEGNRAIAESIIVMAHRLGLQVIAEGIETRAQLELLRAAECDYGQGFYYSEALPPNAFRELLVSQLH